MTYHCGVSLGSHHRPPRIVCDGCGDVLDIDGLPPRWFLANLPPPGWRMLRAADGSKRWDLCMACWKGPPTTSSGEKR